MITRVIKKPVQPIIWSPLGHPRGLLFDLDLTRGYPRDRVTGKAISCSRATTAWAAGRNGTLFEVPINTAVREYKNGGWWLRAEPQSQNVLPQSEDYGDAMWAKHAVSLHGTPVDAPDGTSTAAGLVAMAVNNWHYIYSNPIVAVQEGDTWTFSAWLKAGARSWSLLSIDTYDATQSWIDSHIVYLQAAPYWNREFVSIKLPDTTPNTSYIGVAFGPAGGDGVPDFVGGGTDPEIYAWGAQLEKQPVATSYIPTSGTAVTRNADSLTWPLSAAQAASLGARGQVAARCKFGFAPTDVANSTSYGVMHVNNINHSVLTPARDAGGNSQLYTYDGTTYSSFLNPWSKGAERVLAAQWSGDGMRTGYDSAWDGATDAFDGAYPTNNTGYLFPSPKGPSYIRGLQWWNKPQLGPPAQSLLEW